MFFEKYETIKIWARNEFLIGWDLLAKRSVSVSYKSVSDMQGFTVDKIAWSIKFYTYCSRNRNIIIYMIQLIFRSLSNFLV